MLTSKYNSLFEWNKTDPKAVAAAKQKGIINEICQMFGWEYKKMIHSSKGYWTLEFCKEDALKYKKIYHWAKNNEIAYRTSLKNGWLEECTAHMKKNISKGYWTLELCKENALKYNKKIEWIKNSSSAYNATKANGWLEECTAHMKNVFWTKERCLEEASKHEKRYKWFKASQISYKTAKKNGWFEECVADMDGEWLRKVLIKNKD